MKTTVMLLASAALAGCSLFQPVARPRPEPGLARLAPAQWHSAWPHGGELAGLSRWWQQFQDPLLSGLIDAAQGQSVSVASASARIAQARAVRAAAGEALQPQLGAVASAVRGRQDLSLPPGSSLSAGLQASWEIDLFGGRAATRDAAQARLEGARAGWHDARVAVAAEVAASYITLRACEAQAVQTERDARSRGETARLAELTARAGFQAPADAALSRASAAQARANLTAQRASCDIEVKTLVALTAWAEPSLRAQLAANRAVLPQPLSPGLDAGLGVPAKALAQRPDVRAAELELAAASAEVAATDVQRLPRVVLNGSIAALRLSGGGVGVNGSTWAIGPLQVTLPLFHGTSQRTMLAAARARYDESAVMYRARLLGAVREVENALVRLHSSQQQAPDARIAVEGFEAALRAAEARYKGGLASLFELEESRRTAVQAAASLIQLERERSIAWVQLYRALGGGWEAADLQAALPLHAAGR